MRGENLINNNKNRREWILEHYNLISPAQYGLRKGRSTTENLAILTSDIYTSFSKKHVTVGSVLGCGRGL